MKKRNKNIVCIGGGTGTFVALKGLKTYPYNLSAIVTMSDSGGSNKRIRDEFGLLPTSDIRQCLVALSDENGGVGLLRRLFMYRFEKGEGISGMTFGNLFMAALSETLGSQAEAIRQTGKVLRIQGQVIPVSFTDTNLYAEYENGHIANEEHFIDEPEHDGKLKITKLYLNPEAKANPEAIRAIESAHLLVLGPGDLFTSLLPNLLVDGLRQAVKNSRAHKVYILNLMTKYGQTYNFTAVDHLQSLEKYLGPGVVDSIIVNTQPLPKTALAVYHKYHEKQVIDDFPKKFPRNIIRAAVASRQKIAKANTDKLVRSLIRHDSHKLAKVLVSLIE